MKRAGHKREFPNAMLNAVIKASVETMEHQKKNVKFGSNLKSHSGMSDNRIPPKQWFSQRMFPTMKPFCKVNILCEHSIHKTHKKNCSGRKGK